MGRINMHGMSPGIKSTVNYSAYTKLLVHSNTTDGSTTFTDSSATGRAISRFGSIAHGTGKAKWGTSAVYFPAATSTALYCGDSADWNLGTGAFTIDFWLYLLALPSTIAGLCGQDTDADNYSGLRLEKSGADYIFKFENTHDAVSNVCSGTWTGIAADQWNHVAVIRGWAGSNNNVAICVNGTALSSTDVTGMDIINYTGFYYVGATTVASSISYLNNATGYIDEFRLVKGAAMWTKTFTPPAGPYK